MSLLGHLFVDSAHSTSSYPYINKPITNFTGIYFEHFMNIKYKTNRCTLSAYFDLTNIDQKLEFVDNIYQQTSCLCQDNKVAILPICQHSLNLTAHLIKNLHKSEIELRNLLNHPRRKRGLTNGVGNLLKTAFGTLDADNAQFYDSAIDNVNKNNQYLTKLLKEQTSVVQTTIYNFNNSITEINKNVLRFNKNIQV